MLARVTFSIDDTAWPKLKITGERISPTGDRVAFDDKQQYDLAYGCFENTLHNQLRLAVAGIIERRKQNS
jgi:hypothetical protein